MNGPQEIADLLEFASRLPPGQSRMILTTLGERLAFMWNKVEESFEQLQLDATYLMFDLEATRRERDAYYQTIQGMMEG